MGRHAHGALGVLLGVSSGGPAPVGDGERGVVAVALEGADLALPPKDPFVELPPGLQVGGGELHPAERARLVLLDSGHVSPFGSVSTTLRQNAETRGILVRYRGSFVTIRISSVPRIRRAWVRPAPSRPHPRTFVGHAGIHAAESVGVGDDQALRSGERAVV